MAEITEQRIYDAFGLGAKEQEPAAPAPEETPAPSQEEAGGKVPEGHELPVNGKADNGQPKQEPAAPAGEGAGRESQEPEQPQEPTRKPEEGGEEPPPAPAEVPGEQTEQQRRDHAAQRRREEQQAAVDAAVQKALQEERTRSQAEMDAFFAAAGLKNTITGEPITNMEQFRAWREAFEAARLQRDLKAGKLTPETLNDVISKNPTVKAAAEIVRKGQEDQRRQEMAAAQAKVDAELKEIQKLDPSIREVRDLVSMPTAKEFYELVKKGNSFLDAFRLANYDRLTAQAAEAARQQAQNLARSKEHLIHTQVKGAGAATVPAEELAMFRQFNPGATEAEIQAYYNKYKDKH